MGTKFAYSLASQDLAKVRFAVSPIQHLLLGVQADTPTPRRWMREVSRHIPAAARPFLELATAHPGKYIPDFLSPPLARTSAPRGSAIDDELDLILAVSAEQLADEGRLFESMPSPPRLALELRDGGTAARTRLVRAIRSLYQATLAEDWPDMARLLTADISHRLSWQGEHGSAAMLAGVHWRMREILGLQLEIEIEAPGPVSPWETYTSPGQGLLIAPNLFLDWGLAPSLSPWQQPQLLYPARTALSAKTGSGRSDTLVKLLGRGRAAVLRAVAADCTTTELAARLQVTAPTASVQAAALRDAGLLATARQGRSVRHSLTPLGAALLEANPQPRLR